MNNSIKLIAILVLLFNGLTAQENEFDEQEFFSNIKSSYYSLSNTSLENMTALVTSAKMQAFAQDQWQNAEVFPLQLIWFNPNRLYLSQRGVPELDSTSQQAYQEIVNGLKMQLKGVLVDLQRFYLGTIFEDIQQDYVLKHTEEAVQITFRNRQQGNISDVKYLMGLNGLCLLIEVKYPVEKKTLLIYPEYKTVKTKWLCEGWTVQTLVKGDVQSGFKLKLDNKLVEDIWVPANITLQVQKTEAAGQTFVDQIKLRNYLFNQSIELMNQPKSSTANH